MIWDIIRLNIDLTPALEFTRQHYSDELHSLLLWIVTSSSSLSGHFHRYVCVFEQPELQNHTLSVKELLRYSQYVYSYIQQYIFIY